MWCLLYTNQVIRFIHYDMQPDFNLAIFSALKLKPGELLGDPIGENLIDVH